MTARSPKHTLLLLTDGLADSMTLEFRRGWRFCFDAILREICLLNLKLLSRLTQFFPSITVGVPLFDTTCAGLTKLYV